ncbi:hypothetical protein BaRGS_00034722 [Batillaria attramentaria]|uniref:Uncharacterized protein n=1 Tax=Batillaria attramentaria TaxID=370345 RepID=A0ABD0JGJ7_9CAEN
MKPVPKNARAKAVSTKMRRRRSSLIRSQMRKLMLSATLFPTMSQLSQRPLSVLPLMLRGPKNPQMPPKGFQARVPLK